jgi:hypothetical protein
MRLASLDLDSWQLRSAEESHERNPDTFWLPPRDARNDLRRGQAARLMFDIHERQPDGSLAVQGERMWAIIAERLGDTYIGILDNQPVSVERDSGAYLCFGAEIPFRADHVIDIADPPGEYVEWQLGQPPAGVWPREG